MKKFDPQLAAKYGYTQADWDAAESLELTAEELATAQPFVEAILALAEEMRESLRCLKPADPKVSASLRVEGETSPHSKRQA